MLLLSFGPTILGNTVVPRPALILLRIRPMPLLVANPEFFQTCLLHVPTGAPVRYMYGT